MLAAPARELAQAIAAEWQAQQDKVDPAAMPLTACQLDHRWRCAFARTGRGRDREIPGTDLLFYRAAGPDGLVASQREHWDPIVEWANEKLGARFVLVEGVMHVAQPGAAIAAAAKAIPSGANIHAPGGSARSCRHHADRLGLAGAGARGGRITTDQAWTAAHVDEDWNMQFWGATR